MDFTIVMTVHNTRPDCLLEALHSITTAQTIRHRQPVVLVDDGTTDVYTLGVLAQVEKRADVTIYRTPQNMGTSAALNLARTKVDTEWIVQMDSDDASHPERLEAQLDYLKRHPETDVVGTNLFCFWDGDITRTPFFRSIHKQRPPLRKGDNPYWLCNHGTAMYKQMKVQEVGGYDETKRRGQDVDLWRRMWHQGAQIRNVESILYAWRRYK